MHACQPDYGAQSTPQAYTHVPGRLAVLLNLVQTHRRSPHPSLPTVGKPTHCSPGFGATHSACSIDRRAPQSLVSEDTERQMERQVEKTGAGL